MRAQRSLVPNVYTIVFTCAKPGISGLSTRPSAWGCVCFIHLRAAAAEDFRAALERQPGFKEAHLALQQVGQAGAAPAAAPSLAVRAPQGSPPEAAAAGGEALVAQLAEVRRKI